MLKLCFSQINDKHKLDKQIKLFFLLSNPIKNVKQIQIIVENDKKCAIPEHIL